MENQVLIQFLDDQNTPKTEPLQVPFNISLQHLSQIIETNASLYINGVQIKSTLSDTLTQTDFSFEQIIQIRCIENNTTSKPATFCSSSYSGHEQGVLAIKLFKKKLVSGGGDSTVRFWDVLTKTQYKIQKVNEHWINALDVCEDFVVSGSMDGKVTLFNWEGEFIRHFVGHKKGVSIVKFGNYINISTKEKNVDNPHEEKNIGGCHEEKDKNFIVSGGRDGKIIAWKLSGESFFSYKHEGPIDDLIIKDDLIISCGRDFKIKIYKNYKFIKELTSHTKRINSIKINKNLLVSCSDDYKIITYKVSEDFKKDKEMLHKNIVSCVAISENNLYIASCSFDKTVRIWDAFSGKMLMSYFHIGSVYKVMFKNNLVISCGKDKMIKTFCVGKKKIMSELICGDEIFDIDYNDKMMVCACRDKKVYFFN